jgi:hypothetical protein
MERCTQVVCKYCTFYIRDLSIHEVWYPQGSGNQSLWIAKDDRIECCQLAFQETVANTNMVPALTELPLNCQQGHVSDSTKSSEDNKLRQDRESMGGWAPSVC